MKTMRLYLPVWTALAVLLTPCVSTPSAGATADKKLRTIVTTDGEIDDRCSMVRFLMYANEWDIKGLIYSSSKYHWKGDQTAPGRTWDGEIWIQKQIDLYALVYPSLLRNEPAYPSPDDLRRQVFVGNIVVEGDMRGATAGSDRIVEVLLDEDPSPVWLQAWGGANTIAQALKTIEERHPDRKAEVSRKAKLLLITFQDRTYQDYISRNWPDVEMLLSTAFAAIAYRWRDFMPGELQSYFDGPWMNQHILKDHGPLCAIYEAHRDGAFRSEGDSPAFMHLIDVGLGSHLHPTYGGWGGRFSREGDYWRSAPDDRDPYEAILRWAVAFQNDWAARADWCVKPYDQCNHAPRAVCNGDRTRNVLERSADPGDRIRLSADGSSDPDGHRLSFKWWVYQDAGTYWDMAPLQGAESPELTAQVPENASGRSIHVILQVEDDGRPPLVAYRRVILNVTGEPRAVPADAGADLAYLNTPITRLDGPAAETGPWTFYRGVNLNGPPIQIDGKRWDGDDAANLVCQDTPLHSPHVALRPPTDASRAKMIHSSRWSGRASIKMTDVPKGIYAVYAYLWEDNHSETLSIAVNNETVVRRHQTGVAGEWRRLGPWFVTVTDRSINVTSSGGAANLSGIEVWRKE